MARKVRRMMEKKGFTQQEALAYLLANPVVSPRVMFDLLGLGKNAGYDAIRRGEIVAARYGNKFRCPSRANLDRLGISAGGGA